MTANTNMLDLMVLVADGDMEAAVRSLFERSRDFEIRPIVFKCLRHPQRDSGCRSDCHNYLRPSLRNARHALVLFDHEGCGCEQTARDELESQTENKLTINGWKDRCAVIVIAPELEAWVWSESPVVDEVLGWRGQAQGVREWIRSETGFWHDGKVKPERPKEAMDAALRRVRKPRSPALFQDLAKKVPVDRCMDPSFQKLKNILRDWFPVCPVG